LTISKLSRLLRDMEALLSGYQQASIAL